MSQPDLHASDLAGAGVLILPDNFPVIANPVVKDAAGHAIALVGDIEQSFEFVSIQARIETIAESNSLPGKAGLDLDATLAALTSNGRRRVMMLLEMINTFSEDPDEKAAAAHIRVRALQVWSGLPVSRSEMTSGPS